MKLCATWFHNIVAEKEKIVEQCVCSNITEMTTWTSLFAGAVYQMCKLLNLLFDFPANMLRCSVHLQNMPNANK